MACTRKAQVLALVAVSMLFETGEGDVAEMWHGQQHRRRLPTTLTTGGGSGSPSGCKLAWPVTPAATIVRGLGRLVLAFLRTSRSQDGSSAHALRSGH